jgi:predicted PurR-regulated permease PerM
MTEPEPLPLAGEGAKNKPDVLRYLQIVTFSLIILYFGKSLFIPLFYGLLIAMVMYPVCRRLEEKGLGRSVAIAISLGIVVLLFVALLLLLGWQISLFREDIPELNNKMRPLIPAMQRWLSDHLLINVDTQNQWLKQSVVNLSGNAGHWLQVTLNATAGTLLSLFIIPVYAALFLFHRGTFVRFARKLVPGRSQSFDAILDETIHTYFNYIKGMVLVYLIVGVLNSIGLLALGVKHAILFGMLTAIMTIIPYVGIFVSALLPISVAFITTNSIWYPVGVVAVFSFVQYLEANVIFPKVVGTELNVSTWAMLVAIFTGGIIWGVSGMVLFIPFVGILKIISDHVKEFEALNILLNRNSPVK